ncbi:hypothetical protein [Microbacterium aurantiacum]|uniref:TrbL/VirB6 plasmid conjugal transfer protein n=1 Tax=Microbacterium aurantiacum TaxID=162393 RepID=A0AAJ2LX31_9MICO|nr:hypothetical protein [Microbacterium aurantiacum]MDS0247000.1 hypothetical protein [Microbacterium aurantiacum]
MADAGCLPLDFACQAGDVVSGWVGDLANSAIAEFAQSLVDVSIDIAAELNKWWMSLPSIDLQASALMQVQEDLRWYVMFFAVLGFLFGLIRVLVSNEIRSGIGTAKMILNLILASSAYAVGITLALQAGDAFAPWILERAQGNTTDGMAALISGTAIMALGPGPAVLLALLVFLSVVANALFMILRTAMIALLAVFLPILAAGSGTEIGNQAWKKANGFLIALLLYKPVAATIFAVGIWMVQTPSFGTSGTDAVSGFLGVMTGALILILGALCLPVLIKFLVPVAATGTSNMFSGAGAAGLGLATGAAVVSVGGMVATGGASAAATGAAATGGAANAGAGALSSAVGASSAAGGGAGAGAATGGTTGSAAGGGSTGAGSGGRGGSQAVGNGGGSGGTASSGTGASTPAGAEATPAATRGPSGSRSELVGSTANAFGSAARGAESVDSAVEGEK